MAFKDYINQKEKEKQETSFGQYARQKAGGAAEQPAASASAGGTLLQQLARQAVAAMTNPLQTIQSAALAPARAMNAVSQAAGNIARAGGSVAGALGANGQVTNQVAAQMRALSPTMRAQEAARQQAEQAVAATRLQSTPALRYSLQLARGANRLPSYQSGQQATSERATPYAGMLGPGATAEGYGEALLRRAQNAKATPLYSDTHRLNGYERQMLENRRKQEASMQARRDNSAEYMARYYDNLPNYADFLQRQENPYTRPTAEEMAKYDLMGASWPQEAINRQYMTDDELAKATYLRNTRGEQAAQEYMTSLEKEINARRAEGVQTSMGRLAERYPAAGAALARAINPISGVASGVYMARQIGRSLVNQEPLDMDYNDPLLTPQIARNQLDATVGGQIQQTVNDRIGARGRALGLGNIANTLYQMTMSGVFDSAIRNMTLGGAGEWTMGLDAMTQGMRTIHDRGGTDEQAFTMGTIEGVLEILTEHMKSEDIAKALLGGDQGALKQVLNAMVSEGIEEGASELIGTIADTHIMGDMSDYAEAKRKYINQGMNNTEASVSAVFDMAGNVGEAILGGMWGGGLLSGGSYAAGSAARTFSQTAEAVAARDVQKLSKAYDGRAREVFLNSWDGQLTPAEYKTAFDALYDSGRLGVSLEQTQETAGKTLEALEPARQYQIWQAGENAAQAERQEYTDPISGEDFTAEMPARKPTSSAADAAPSPEGKARTGAENNENAAGRVSTDTRDAEIAAMPDVSGRTEAERFNPATVKGGVVKNYTARRLNYRQGVNIRALDRLGKRLGIEFEIVDSIKAGKGQANAQYAGGRRFLVALNATENAYLQAGAHELVHYVRNYDADGYRAMERIVVDALGRDATFDIEEQISKRQDEYAQAGQQLTREQALEEIVAEAVPTVFSDQKVIEQLVMEDRTLAEKIGDWLHQFIEKVTKALRESVADYAVSQGREEIASLYNQAEALREIAKAFDSALERAGENAAARETTRQAEQETQTEEKTQAEEMPAAASIVTDAKGRKIVKADRQVISGNDPNQWRTQIMDYINTTIRNGKDVQLTAADGDVLTITQDTAGKARFRNMVKQADGTLKPMTDAQFEAKLRAEAHIDELAQISTRGANGKLVPDTKNHPFAKNGWNYRTAYFEDQDGKKYRVTLSVGKTGNVNTVYNVGRMKESYSIAMGSKAEQQNAAGATGLDSKPIIQNGSGPVKGENRQSLRNLPDQARFSMKAPVERKGELVAVHNLESEDMSETLELGGFPMPSVAIVKAEQGHSMYGPISVVFKANAIDPAANRENKVYGQDAWTPTFPQIDAEFNKKNADKLVSRLVDLENRIDSNFRGKLTSLTYDIQYALSQGGTSTTYEDQVDKAKRNLGMKAAYLEDLGRHAEPEVTEKDKGWHDGRLAQYESVLKDVGKSVDEIINMNYTERTEAFRDAIDKAFPGASKMNIRLQNLIKQTINYAVAKDAGFPEVEKVYDPYASEEAIDKQIDEKQFDAWVRDLFDGVYGDKMVRNDKSVYTDTGNRRTFKQLHWPYSAENIVRAMKGANEKGGFSHGATGLMAVSSKEYGSLDAVRKDSERLANVPQDEYDHIIADLDRWINEFCDKVSEYNVARRKMITANDAEDALAEAAKAYAKKGTLKAAQDAFVAQGVLLDNEQAKELEALINAAQEVPSGYFEAKPRRVVGFDEVAAVLVPDDMGKGLMDKIRDAGMNVITYTADDEAARLAALNSIDQPGVRFALKNTSDTPVETERVLEGIDGRPAIQLHTTPQTDEMKAKGEALAQERKEAKQRFEGQKAAQTENRVSREAAQAEKAALQTAKQILKEYESKYDKNAMRDNMLALTEEIAKNGASDDTLREATQLARAIIEQSSHVDTGMREQYKDLRKTLRETPVTLTETQKAEAANIAGSYGAFRQSVFGTFNLATEGKSLDAIWDEWSGIAPDLFTPQMNEGDMVQRLVDIRAAFMPTVSNPYGEDMDGASVDLGLRLQESVLKALGDDAGAKDMADAITELRRQYQDAMREERMRVKMQQRAAFDQIAAALRAARDSDDEAAKDAAMAAYRGQMKRIGAEEAEAQARLAYRLRFEDRAERAKTWERITKYATDMRNTLAKPNKKKHVPQELQKDLLGVLEGLDFTRNGRVSEGTQAWKDSLTRIDEFLNEQLLRQQNPEGDTRGIWMSVCKPALDLFHANVEVIKNARGPINQMTLNEMKNLSSALAQVNHAINSINEMWTNARHETVDEVAGRTMDELDKVRTNKAQNSIAPISMLDTMLNIENLDAGSFFQRLGKAAMMVYDGLREGQSKAYARIREANEAAKTIFTNSKKEIRQWAKEQHDVGVSYGAELRTVKMTGTQLMELYALSRREQGRKHLLTGGFELEGRNGKSGDARIYKLTEDQLNAAVSQLSKDQKATTERMQDYLSHTVSEWGNEVTERMYLYRMFGEDYYWPIRSATGFQQTREQDGTVLYNAQTNAGFTKNVQDEVRNPLRIGDAITTYSGHVSDMATFSGLAMPVDDLLRWYNYAAKDENGHIAYTTSVKNEIRRTLGKDGTSYVQHLLDDLNGMGKSAQVSKLAKWMMGSYKRAAIMAKLRVVIQQPTAILRASAEINPAYLTAAVRGIGKHTVNEMQEHSALAWWKGNGNYEIGTGASMKSIVTGMQDSAKDDIFEWMNKPAGWADDKGWATIWRAVKAETAAKHKDLTVGSDEYWAHVVDRFEEICMKTQVVDTVLTRSAMMRSKDTLMKMATAFMSEPTKTVNMIRNAMGDFHRAQQAGDKSGMKRSAGKIIRSGAAVAAATALNALATAAFDALKYYDPDDKDEEGNPITQWDLIKENWWADYVDGMNPLTNIPFVKDVYNMFEGVLKGEQVSVAERMDMSTLGKVANAATRAIKYFLAGNPNGYTTWAAVKPLVTGIGDVLGLPVSGLVANTEFALNIIRPGFTRSKARAATVTGAVEEIYEAITSGDREKADRLRANMEKGQYGRDPMSEKEISKKLTDMLARNDDRVRQAWEAKQDIDGGAIYTRLRNTMMSDGWTKDEVNYAIDHYDDVMIADAKKGLREANEKEDAAQAEAWRDVLRDFGQTEDQIAKAEAEKDLEETLESPKATYRDLYQMLRAGETAEASDLRGQLRAQGKTPEEISKGVADQLAMNDDRIQALWEKRQKGKATTAADYRPIQNDGFTDEEVKQAVNRYPNIVQSEAKNLLLQAQTDGDKAAMETYRQRLLSVGTKAETIDGWLAGKDMDAELEDVAVYKTENLMASIRSTETTAADIQDIRDYLMSQSKAADPLKSIQSSITSNLKDEYIDLVTSGKTKEAERLKKNMLLAGAKEDTIDNWVPAQAKSEGKSALMAAIDKGDERAAIAEVDRMLDNEIATVDSIRDSLNKVYKPKYFELMDAGKEREADALADLLAGLGLKKKSGENYYRGAWWNEEYRKHLKEMEE